MSFPPAFHTPRLSFTPINADMHAAAVFETRGREDVMKYSINHAPDSSIAATHAWLSRFNHSAPSPGPLHLDAISPIGYVISERPSPTSTSTSISPDQPLQPEIIGTTGLRLGVSPSSPSSSLVRRWEIGYGFHPTVWGRGLATETVQGWKRVVSEGLVDFSLSSGSESGSGSGSGTESGTETGSGTEKGGEVKRVLAACTDARNEASRRVLEKCGFVVVGEFEDEEGRGNWEFEVVF